VPLADFEITVHYENQPRTVRVIAYETVKALRSAATRYDNRTGRDGHNPDTLGVCHRFTHGLVLDDGTFEAEPLCAIVRLAKPMLGVGYISHELAHAAVWMHELDVVGPDGEHEAEYRGIRTEDDEEFCWVLGELVRQTVTVLNDKNVW
jgi:hypothetical protein